MIHESGKLDLEIRKGKTTGGFCFPIDKTGVCFICMNVAGRSKEKNVLIHESGHGLHAYYHANEKIREYRMFASPGELAELPAMTMELLALEYNDIYYDNIEDIKAAKKEKLIETLMFLRKCTMIDALEQWVCNNPDHSNSERTEYYNSLEDRFNIGVDWSSCLEEKSVGWYRSQLVIIEPFYIISYALAQLGAVAIYKNYKENKEKTINQFEELLACGFSKPIDKLYKIAGIKFDFTEKYVKEIVDFIVKEIDDLD